MVAALNYCTGFVSLPGVSCDRGYSLCLGGGGIMSFPIENNEPIWIMEDLEHGELEALVYAETISYWSR